jgi:Ser/Thr protein kinase RdoA (MazF antagonist)
MNKQDKQVPEFLRSDAERYALDLFGIKAKAKELYSYQDQNFHLRCDDGNEYMLKIANVLETKKDLKIQNQVMLQLSQNTSPSMCPKPLPARSGERIVSIKDRDGDKFFVRLLTYLKGVLLAESLPHSPDLMYEFGCFIGRMVKAFSSIPDIKFRTDFYWNMSRGPETVKKYKNHINNPDYRSLVGFYIDLYESSAVPLLPELRCSLIQNDANDYNIIISPAEKYTEGCEQRTIAGIIDFGDTVYSYTICELAIALAYIMMKKNDPIKTALFVLSGYSSTISITETELKVLFPMICMRLIMSVSFSAYKKKLSPDNKYLVISEKPAWALLERFKNVNPHSIYCSFRDACGKKEHG